MLVTGGILLAALLAAPPLESASPPPPSAPSPSAPSPSSSPVGDEQPVDGESSRPTTVEDDPRGLPAADGRDARGLPTTPPGMVLDRVLPSGVRVLVARDESLPVAAVVLAIESGLEDDPEGAPGLTHVLAHHLQQGNRQLRPGAALDNVHGQGGLATMAVGARQVRFESLVPAFALQRVLEVEAVRLVNPTLDDGLWQRSVDAARRDRLARPPVDEHVWAGAWGRPSLRFARRARDASLAKLPPSERANAMQRSFDPRRATLVVVSPDEPRAVLDAVEAAFSNLPRAERALPSAPQTPPQPGAARQLVARGAKQRDPSARTSPPSRFVTPVHTTTTTGDVVGDAESLALARVLCATLNRQPASPGSNQAPHEDAPPASASQARRGARDGDERVRCRTFEDPRRPLLVIDVVSSRPGRDVLAERLDRVVNGADASLIESQRERQRAILERDVETPLGLARTLALSAPIVVGNPDDVQTRPWTSLVGLAALADPNGLRRVLGGLLDAQLWWEVVDPSTQRSGGDAPSPDGDTGQRQTEREAP